MMQILRRWRSLSNSIEHHALISAWRAKRLSSDQAWSLLEQHHAFRSKTLALMRFVTGIGALSVTYQCVGNKDAEWQVMLHTAINTGLERGHLNGQGADFLRELFDLKPGGKNDD